MAIEHARPAQPVDISPLGEALSHSASHAILKTHSLELMRVVLRAGQSVPPHKVYGEITLLCIEGAVSVEVAGGGASQLKPWQLVLLPAQAEYALQASQDCSLLVTVQTPIGLPGSASSTQRDSLM